MQLGIMRIGRWSSKNGNVDCGNLAQASKVELRVSCWVLGAILQLCR